MGLTAGFKSSIEIGQALGDEAIYAIPTSLMARMKLFTLDYQSGLNELDEVIPALMRIGEKGEHTLAQGYLAFFHAALGNFPAADRLSTVALD